MRREEIGGVGDETEGRMSCDSVFLALFRPLTGAALAARLTAGMTVTVTVAEPRVTEPLPKHYSLFISSMTSRLKPVPAAFRHNPSASIRDPKIRRDWEFTWVFNDSPVEATPMESTKRRIIDSSIMTTPQAASQEVAWALFKIEACLRQIKVSYGEARDALDIVKGAAAVDVTRQLFLLHTDPKVTPTGKEEKTRSHAPWYTETEGVWKFTEEFLKAVFDMRVVTEVRPGALCDGVPGRPIIRLKKGCVPKNWKEKILRQLASVFLLPQLDVDEIEWEWEAALP